MNKRSALRKIESRYAKMLCVVLGIPTRLKQLRYNLMRENSDLQEYPCPDCGQPMWFTEKKHQAVEAYQNSKLYEIKITCWDCIGTMSDLVDDAIRIDI